MVLVDKKWTIDVAFKWIQEEHKDLLRYNNKQALNDLDAKHNLRWFSPLVNNFSLVVDRSHSVHMDQVRMGGLIRKDAGAWVKGFHAGMTR